MTPDVVIPLDGSVAGIRRFDVPLSIRALPDAKNKIGCMLMKEELDAGGSSGFSFSDLLADMAGTRFALYVTRDATTARASQEWLAGDVTVDELFPPAVDLPEGIPDARLRADYGGVGGDGYRAMIGELEERLGTCRYGQ